MRGDEFTQTLSVSGLSAKISAKLSLRDIDFKLQLGSTTAIIGPNGAGKTSLLRSISGDLAYQHGQIEFNGKPMSDWPDAKRAKCFAVLPQHSVLEFPFSVEEVVAMGRIPHSSSAAENREIVQQALAAVDCEALHHRSYTTLSGGEKQRVQLARVAAQVWKASQLGQRCLILDEPSASLDLAHQELLVDLLASLKSQGIAIAVVLHDLNLAAKCADQILVLHHGQQVALGAADSVYTQELLASVFNSRAQIIRSPEANVPLVVS